MNQRDALFEAIVTNPGEDTPRLVLADWLQEEGDARDYPLAEFIRVQIELEPIRECIFDPRHSESDRARTLFMRELELLEQYQSDWRHQPHWMHYYDENFGPILRRGFPAYAGLSLGAFLGWGEELLNPNKTLREISLHSVATCCHELASSELLARLDTLEIADWPNKSDAEALAALPHINQISRLRLWLGGEPHLLNALVAQKWSGKIELVQLGVEERSGEAKQVEDAANRTLGRDAVSIVRPFRELFPLSGHLDWSLCAGRLPLPDSRPVLAAANFRRWVLVIFDEDGNVVDVQSEHSRVSSHELEIPDWDENVRYLQREVEKWMTEEVRLTPGLIWVREFETDDLSLCFWPNSLRDNAGRLNLNSHRLAENSSSAVACARKKLEGDSALSWIDERGEESGCTINWLGERVD